VKATDGLCAACARYDERRLATLQDELEVTLAKRRIDGDDDCAEINAREIEDRQLAAVRNHHADTVALAYAAPAEFRSQGAGLPVKIAVGDFTAGGGVDEEDVLLAARYDVHDRFAGRYFVDRHFGDRISLIVISPIFVWPIFIASPRDWVAPIS
jgi:hypothetical protein